MKGGELEHIKYGILRPGMTTQTEGEQVSRSCPGSSARARRDFPMQRKDCRLLDALAKMTQWTKAQTLNLISDMKKV